MKSNFNPKSHLEKYGWSEGNGLGRSQHGIRKAIKPKMKANALGLGYDLGETFSFHWWDHMFNKAAENINVENSEDGVKMKASSELNVSTKKESVKTFLSKDLLYGNFVKSTSTLQDGKEVSHVETNADDSDSSEEDCATVFKFSDDDLMRICGGRTAHKGARHGLTLSGKLARLAEQEQQHSRANSEASNSPRNDHNYEGGPLKKKKLKKSKREKKASGKVASVVDNCCAVDCISKPSSNNESENQKKSKKKKAQIGIATEISSKAAEASVRSVSCENSVESKISAGDQLLKKKKKKRKQCSNETNDEHHSPLSAQSEGDEPRRKKSKQLESVDSHNTGHLFDSAAENCSSKKLKKKQKCKLASVKMAERTKCSEVILTNAIGKKKSKSKKKKKNKD